MFDPRWADAISGIESGGQYGLLGPVTKSGDRAYGKYQVMGSNVGQWTKQVLGQSMTPQQFLNNPQAQDAVFKAKFGQSVSKYGNPQDAASIWFTGKPLAQGATKSDQLGTTGASYVDKFNTALGLPQAVAQGSSPLQITVNKQAPSAPIPQPQQSQPSQSQMPFIGGLAAASQNNQLPNLSGLQGLFGQQQPMSFSPATRPRVNLMGLAPLLSNAPQSIQNLIYQG
jgi:hypothetical protein